MVSESDLLLPTVTVPKLRLAALADNVPLALPEPDGWLLLLLNPWQPSITPRLISASSVLQHKLSFLTENLS